jgi:hypothetical protein
LIEQSCGDASCRLPGWFDRDFDFHTMTNADSQLFNALRDGHVPFYFLVVLAGRSGAEKPLEAPVLAIGHGALGPARPTFPLNPKPLHFSFSPDLPLRDHFPLW